MAISIAENADCMIKMAEFPDNFFDILVTDPPYAITNNKWDTPIDLVALWGEWERIVKDDGAFLFTSAQPFTTDLINSNRKIFKYDLVWEKSIATGFLNANRMPLRSHEIVLVFYRKLPTYNPQKQFLSAPSFKKAQPRRDSSTSNYGKFDYKIDHGSKDGSRFPRSVFNVPYENSFFDSSSSGLTIHPTQKPIALFKYLISTFSNPGDKVLDYFLGSGSSRLAAHDLNRCFWGYELDTDYFEAQEKRFKQHISQLTLSI